MESAGKDGVLKQRLKELNAEIARLRKQQQLFIRPLMSEDKLPQSRVMNKKRWVAMLRNAGMADAGMDRWHAVFESQAPEAHQDFLESLGLPAEEIAAIRARTRSDVT